MSFSRVKVGVDIEEVSRFSDISLNNRKFLDRIYTTKEQTYCFSRKDPSPHLAGRYAAKEAIIKALAKANIKVKFIDIEINSINNNLPVASIKKYPDLYIDLSIAHNPGQTVAVAIVETKN